MGSLSVATLSESGRAERSENNQKRTLVIVWSTSMLPWDFLCFLQCEVTLT